MGPTSVSQLGDALFPAGQAFTVQRTFHDTAGLPVDLTGRSYALSFFAAGNELLRIGGTINGTVAAFAVSSANTLMLFAAQQTGKLIQWQIVEQVGGLDADFVFGPRSFRLTAAGPIGPGNPGTGQVGAPALEITSANGPAAVWLNSMGSPGFSAAQIVHRARPDQLADTSDAAFAAYIDSLVSEAVTGNAAIAPSIAANAFTGGETLLIVSNGGIRSITFEQLVLAINEWRTVGFSNPGQTAIDIATGIL